MCCKLRVLTDVQAQLSVVQSSDSGNELEEGSKRSKFYSLARLSIHSEEGLSLPPAEFMKNHPSSSQRSLVMMIQYQYANQVPDVEYASTAQPRSPEFVVIVIYGKCKDDAELLAAFSPGFHSYEVRWSTEICPALSKPDANKDPLRRRGLETDVRRSGGYSASCSVHSFADSSCNGGGGAGSPGTGPENLKSESDKIDHPRIARGVFPGKNTFEALQRACEPTLFDRPAPIPIAIDRAHITYPKRNARLVSEVTFPVQAMFKHRDSLLSCGGGLLSGDAGRGKPPDLMFSRCIDTKERNLPSQDREAVGRTERVNLSGLAADSRAPIVAGDASSQMTAVTSGNDTVIRENVVVIRLAPSLGAAAAQRRLSGKPILVSPSRVRSG
ncbi:hypothetical protein B0H19DRAFT_1312720 [Mycena capillaripes]|nr:hypothetical protein B0H19DRAFT_1312720 [Mycena capillaripes]